MQLHSDLDLLVIRVLFRKSFKNVLMRQLTSEEDK